MKGTTNCINLFTVRENRTWAGTWAGKPYKLTSWNKSSRNGWGSMKVSERADALDMKKASDASLSENKVSVQVCICIM